MAVTVIGGASPSLPLWVCAPIIEVTHTWGWAWGLDPELELIRCVRAAAGHDLSMCEFRRAYGRIKEPYQSDFGTRTSWNLSGWWVRVRLIGDQGEQVAFVGQVPAGDNAARDIYGSDTAATGIQSWVAYGGRQLLRTTWISRSVWLVDGEERTLGWTPDFNTRDARKFMVGNRSAEKNGASYLFGGTSAWTRTQAVEYVLKRFVQTAAGPT